MNSKSGGSWYRDWRGKTAVVVAAGPSASEAPLETIRGLLPVLAVKESWRLVPWADVLYGCDDKWWIVRNGVTGFHGLKITSNHRCSSMFPDLHRVRMDGNNSGIRAVRLAELYGATRIVLVGFDMHPRNGIHWHGPHGPELRNADADKMEIWRKEMDAAKFTADVINTSKSSALKSYRYLPFAEAIRDGDQDQDTNSRSRY